MSDAEFWQTIWQPIVKKPIDPAFLTQSNIISIVRTLVDETVDIKLLDRVSSVLNIYANN